MIASLWGIWHIVLDFTLAMLWRSKPIQYGEQLRVGSFGTVRYGTASGSDLVIMSVSTKSLPLLVLHQFKGESR